MTAKPCVLVPCYENPRTVEAVVRGSAEHCHVIVVDDGSSDATPRILAALAEELDSVTVITHEQNAGKGQALITGMARAEELGFSHAISIDSDGQHSPEDIPRFLDVIAKRPGALVLGHRDLRAAGAGITQALQKLERDENGRGFCCYRPHCSF